MIHTFTTRINVCSDFYSQFISHQQTKEQLIAAIEAVSQAYQRVDKVRAACPDLEVDKCKKILREMDINLVTLDKNSKVKELPSIPALLRETIEEEKDLKDSE